MAKFYGKVGYVSGYNNEYGIYKEIPMEKTYYGDVLSNYRRVDGGEGKNSDIILNNKLSIIADQYALGNLQAIKYVYINGSPWEVTNVEIEYPRIILTIGGVWNGNTVGTSEDSGDDPGDEQSSSGS